MTETRDISASGSGVTPKVAQANAVRELRRKAENLRYPSQLGPNLLSEPVFNRSTGKYVVRATAKFSR
jgi:hypothetical protein